MGEHNLGLNVSSSYFGDNYFIVRLEQEDDPSIEMSKYSKEELLELERMGAFITDGRR